jgi:hypothetical protein
MDCFNPFLPWRGLRELAIGPTIDIYVFGSDAFLARRNAISPRHPGW